MTDSIQSTGRSASNSNADLKGGFEKGTKDDPLGLIGKTVTIVNRTNDTTQPSLKQPADGKPLVDMKPTSVVKKLFSQVFQSLVDTGYTSQEEKLTKQALKILTSTDFSNTSNFSDENIKKLGVLLEASELQDDVLKADIQEKLVEDFQSVCHESSRFHLAVFFKAGDNYIKQHPEQIELSNILNNYLIYMINNDAVPIDILLDQFSSENLSYSRDLKMASEKILEQKIDSIANGEWNDALGAQDFSSARSCLLYISTHYTGSSYQIQGKVEDILTDQYGIPADSDHMQYYLGLKK